MNTVVTLPIIAAAPTTAPAMPAGTTDRRALEAYAAWLHMERRILCHELWPHLGSDADKFVWADNAGFDWHFRGRGKLAWNEGPQPSSRAAAVLDVAGVDWRAPRENLGLNHADPGARPTMPAQWPHRDAELLALAEQYAVAFKKWSALNRIFEEMDERSVPPRVYRKAKREAQAADLAYIEIENRIAEIQATTVEGLMAKIKCAQAYAEGYEITFDEGSCGLVMARSIFDDLIEVMKRRDPSSV